MSLTRFAAPGRPTILVDQGPATGRVSHSRLGIKGGSVFGAMVVGTSKPKPDRRMTQERPRVYRPHHPVCGKPKGAGTCARVPGHRWDCRTREGMDKAAAERRTGHSAVNVERQTPEERRAYFREWQRERRAVGLR